MVARIVIILGMHRSGTSAVTRAVQSLGFNLGKHLIEPNEENIKGFFENREIVSFNDRLLCHADLSWDSIGYIWDEDFTSTKYREYVEEAKLILTNNFEEYSLWAIKDPRICILLPFWKRVLGSMGIPSSNISYVLCIRNVLESFYSQQKRNQKDPSFHIIGSSYEPFLLMWYTYIRKAISEINSNLCLCVSYERIINDPENELKRVAKFLNVRTDQNILSDYSRYFLNPSLQHNKASIEEFINSCKGFEFVADFYLRLKNRDSGGSLTKEDLLEILDSTKNFEELLNLYLVNTQRLYGRLYHQHLQTRKNLHEESVKTLELRNRLSETERLLNIIISSLRWRFICAVCKIVGR